jgi:hypothetical protein
MKHDRAEQADDVGEADLPCEACAITGETGSGRPEPRALGDRLYWLCPEHRAKADAAPSADARRALFQEPGGQRSLLPRRSEERRAFPPRPEGRRMGSGRRRADPLV